MNSVHYKWFCRWVTLIDIMDLWSHYCKVYESVFSTHGYV